MRERIKELVDILNKASKAYYREDREIMSNYEYDKLYDELTELEKETKIVLSDSPTRKVGYELLDELQKERHEKPMLSLDKTKELSALREFLKDKEGLLSWKLDGLTIVLTYNNGKLTKAVTRGNGEVGEVITNNALVFKNLPVEIPYKGELILRGEAIITYSDFNKINQEITDVDAKYKNPRNLCSGSVRQLSNEVTAKRSVRFYAFALVKCEGVDFSNSFEKQFEWLSSQGFDVVEYKKVNAATIEEKFRYFEEAVKTNDFPSDGLVLTYNDIAYGESLGRTAKFPRNAIAFKWQDEIAKTTLRYIEWSPSRTGLINPVAVFEPVELEGTTVSRASVHNISILEELNLCSGDEITVYKANMIIPQIAENLNKDTGSYESEIPEVCPVCGGKAEIIKANDVKSLYCINKDCQAKKVKSFAHFVGRDAMNIDGFSEASIEKFIQKGFIRELRDLFEIEKYREEIIAMEGFKEKSYNNLVTSIENAKHTSLAKLVYSLGIPNIGLSNAKMICNYYDNDVERLLSASAEEMTSIDGVGAVIARSLREYFDNDKNREQFIHLLSILEIEEEEVTANDNVTGKTFVITGSLALYENRNALKALIENMGGKVTGSVTKNTDYLINNDTESSSSKNKKAKELNIPIISEEDFNNMIQ